MNDLTGCFTACGLPKPLTRCLSLELLPTTQQIRQLVNLQGTANHTTSTQAEVIIKVYTLSVDNLGMVTPAVLTPKESSWI